jgi:membrane-associated phospholipid phosphatase
VVDRPAQAIARPVAHRLQSWHPGAAAGATIVMAYVVLSLLTLGVGVVLLEVVVADGRNQWDVIGWNRWFTERFDPTMDSWSGWFSRLADTITVVSVVAVLAVVFLLLKKWPSALFLVTALTLEVSVFLTMTLLLDRNRPDLPKPDEVPPTSSYPSGHTAAGTALYFAIALLVAARLRSRAAQVVVLLLGLVPGVLVAVGRVARNMHHPTDTMVGYALGLLCVLAAAVVVAVALRVAAARQETAGGLR